MAAHLQVILKEDVEHLGATGDLVRVRPGYARNYLIPRGLAAMATRASIRQIEHEKKNALAKAAKERSNAAGIAAALAEVTFEIERKAGEEGKLYGSVTAADIAELLEAKDYSIDRRKIVLSPIKTVGVYDVEVKLAGGLRATFKLDVRAAN